MPSRVAKAGDVGVGVGEAPGAVEAAGSAPCLWRPRGAGLGLGEGLGAKVKAGTGVAGGAVGSGVAFGLGIGGGGGTCAPARVAKAIAAPKASASVRLSAAEMRERAGRRCFNLPLGMRVFEKANAARSSLVPWVPLSEARSVTSLNRLTDKCRISASPLAKRER